MSVIRVFWGGVLVNLVGSSQPKDTKRNKKYNFLKKWLTRSVPQNMCYCV